VFSGALTLSLRDKAQIIFNSHRLHDCFLSLDKTLVDGEVSSQFKAQYMPLVRFYLALSSVMASVMYAPHHNSPGDLLRGFSSSTHGEFDRCFEFAKLLDDNIQASIQSLLSFFELELRSPIAKSAFNLLGELYIRFGAKPYAQAIYSDALVQLLSDPMVAHVQLKHLYFLCTNDGFNLDIDRTIHYMGMIGGKNKINIIDHKILDLYACNFIEGSLFHVLKSQFESHPDQITAWLHQLPEYSNVSNDMAPIKYLENKKIALLMPLISSSSCPYFDVLIRRL
tara:strand:+ start:8112 stop:8957 length:846 start_codon:yes stop_codon:yes gene_type:complete